MPAQPHSQFASQITGKIGNVPENGSAVFASQASLDQCARPKSFNHSSIAIWNSYRKVPDVAEIVSVYYARPLSVSINRQFAIDIQRWDTGPEVEQPRKTESRKILERSSPSAQRICDLVLKLERVLSVLHVCGPPLKQVCLAS
jgi:hypothetical protein